MIEDLDVKTIMRGFVLESFMYRSVADSLDDDALLMKRGLIDSMGMLVLLSFLEERFGIEVTDEEVEPENLESINAIAAFVGRKTGASSLSRAT